ncbi:MAG: type II toxin-antitoxin system PemK/MazF family toxin [Candidatus Vogelbacteria bacterium]|nr:type II toxin-antitoxin system PemK/MazF family toxin [Candidatus Vogelbacteria bacterium]
MLITKELIRIFTNWTKLKIRLHVAEREIFPHEREIWWASLGQNVGVEINGKNDNFERPVLIIKKFNDQMLLILPLTGKTKEEKYYYQFKGADERFGSVVLSQIRLISSKRLIRKVGEVSENDFLEIKRKTKGLF